MKTAMREAFETAKVNRKTNLKLALRVIDRMRAQDQRIDKAKALRVAKKNGMDLR